MHSPFMFLTASTTCQSGPDFVCCHVDDALLYLSPFYLDCDGNTVANDLINDTFRKPEIVLNDEQLHIVFNNDDLFSVSVFNIQGALITQQKGNRNEASISLNGIPKGVYVIRIISGEYVYSQKIIK